MQTRLFGLFYSDKTVGRPSTRGPRFGNFGCTPWGTMGKGHEPQVVLKTDEQKSSSNSVAGAIIRQIKRLTGYPLAL
jgi:hypothetical protein